MLTVATAIAFASLALAAPLILLGLAGRVQRAREERVERQIAVTDAIHRELGAVVAPVVTRRGRNAWKVAMAAPFDRPVAVGRILAIAYDVVAAEPSAPPEGRTPRRPPEGRTLTRPPDVSFVVTPRTAAR
jgi:hypothetical protein